MKLKDNFITHTSDDEQILIDVSGNGFSGLVRSNATAAFIVDCLAEETDEQAIAEKMLNAFEGATKEAVLDDIAMVVKKLRSIGAIDE